MQETRRTALKRGGATLAALSTLGGCLSLGGQTETDRPAAESEGDGGDGSDGGGGKSTPTATPTATPVADRPSTPAGDLTRWMPDPGVIDQSGYAFLAIAPAALSEFEGDLGDGAVGQFDEEYPIDGIGSLGDLTAVYRFARTASVLVGEFDRTPVEDSLRQYGFETGEARGGFRLFSTTGSRAAAVRDGMLVTVGSFGSSDEADKLPVVEAIVDARTGQGPRYVDAVEDCARLLDAIGSAHLLQGRTHETGETFENGLGEGMGYHVAADRTRAHAAALFDGSADESAMREWATDSEAFLGGEPTVRADGAVVTATATVQTGDVTEFPSEFPGPAVERERTGPPAVTFSFDYESVGDGVGVLTVTHDGGETVPRDELYVRGSGFAEVDGADQTEAGVWRGSVGGDEGGVVAGDTVEVGVASDYGISLVWIPDEGESAVLAEHLGPDA